MVVARGVLFQSVQRVPGDVLTSAYVMVEARDAYLKVAEKVLRAALTSAKPMVEGRGALGDTLVPNSATMMVLATHLLGENPVCACLMVPWFKIKEFMAVQL